MNIETGEIRSFPSREDATAAGFRVELTDAEVLELEGLSDEARRVWIGKRERELRRRAVLGALPTAFVAGGAIREVSITEEMMEDVPRVKRYVVETKLKGDPPKIVAEWGDPDRPYRPSYGVGGRVLGSFAKRRRVSR